MQAIWVLAILAVAAADVSHLGYHYKVPHTSYGVPSYQVGGSSGHYHSGLGSSGPGVSYKGSEGQYLGSSFSRGDQGAPSHLTGDAQLSASTHDGGVASGFGSGLSNGYASGFGNRYSSGLSSGFSSGLGGDSSSSSGQYYQTVGGPSTVQPIYHGSNEYQTTNYNSGEKYQQFYQVQSNEPAQVYKHFYLHSAPEEPELPKPRTPIVLPPPQKHYKIIFVKTPNVESHSSQIVPVQPQAEEKTIVYVLVKKPDEHREVLVPKVEQKPPTKPEVYFIKYNNKEDSQSVINNIVNDYNKPGQSVSYNSGGSDRSPVVSGLPFSQSSGSGYISGSSGLSDYPSSSFSSSTYPSGGISNGFTNFPSSSSNSNLGFSSSVPTSIGSSFTGSPSSFSTGSSVPITGLFNRFGSSSDSNSVLSSGSNSNSGLSSGSTSGLNSGFGLTNLLGSSQSDVSVQAPIVSSSVSSQSFSENIPESSDASNDAGAAASSIFGGISPSFTSTSGAVQEDTKTVPASQGLPHETYGVPKFRIA